MELPNTSSAFTADPTTYGNRATVNRNRVDSPDDKVEVMVVCRFKFPASQSILEIQQWLDENMPMGESDRFTITSVDIERGK